MVKASQNKNAFSWRLKAAWDGVLRSDSGKRFHAARPAKAKPSLCKLGTHYGATEIARPDNATPNSRAGHRETTRSNAK